VNAVTRTSFTERLRLYSEARGSGEPSYNAAIAAGVDPGRDARRYERWYQAQLAAAAGREPPPPLSPDLACRRRRAAARTRMDSAW
jgi:hypothetical protein